MTDLLTGLYKAKLELLNLPYILSLDQLYDPIPLPLHVPS